MSQDLSRRNTVSQGMPRVHQVGTLGDSSPCSRNPSHPIRPVCVPLAQDMTPVQKVKAFGLGSWRLKGVSARKPPFTFRLTQSHRHPVDYDSVLSMELSGETCLKGKNRQKKERSFPNVFSSRLERTNRSFSGCMEFHVGTSRLPDMYGD